MNRRLGRLLAAGAYVWGRTPNQVTAVSAVFTLTAIATIAVVPPTPASSIAIVVMLALGYALDSADGQLARLRGGGSGAGEWLDHTLDAIKLSTVHLAVLIGWYRFSDLSETWMLVPIGFQAVSSVLFFTVILTDQIRRARRGLTRMLLQGEGTSSVAYALAVLPTDDGLLILCFGLWWWSDGFAVSYGVIFALNFVFLALALPKWFRELDRVAD